jgi:hypothetical protein
MKENITNGDKNLLIANIMKINDTLNINKITNKIKYSNKKKDELKIEIEGRIIRITKCPLIISLISTDPLNIFLLSIALYI